MKRVIIQLMIPGGDRVKIVYKLVFVLCCVMLFWGCTDQKDNEKTPTSEQVNYTYEEFYGDLVIYEYYLDYLIDPTDDPVILSSSETSFLLGLNSDESAQNIYREELLSLRNQFEYTHKQDTYKENLSRTLLYIKSVREALGDQYQIPMNTSFSPLYLPNATFTFAKSIKGYIYIETIIENTHTFIKLGFNQHRLDYQELIYEDTTHSSPKDDSSLSYQYYKFLEYNESILIDYTEQQTSINYTNIETSENWLLKSGINVLNEPYANLFGYDLVKYDPKTNVEMHLQVLGDSIFNEEYIIYDEHGWVYRYKNRHLTDDTVQLNMNIIMANGWDYTTLEQTMLEHTTLGLYMSDGSNIYEGPLSFTSNQYEVSLDLGILLSQDEPLSDDLLSLESYGLYMDHPKANVDFLDNIKIDDIEKIKSALLPIGMNVFADNLHNELFFFMDETIKQRLETEDSFIPIDIPYGDYKSYENALLQFSKQLQIEPNYVMGGSFTVSITNQNGKKLFSASTFEQQWFDLNAMFFKHVYYGDGIDTGYYIDGTHGNLIDYQTTGTAIHYQVLDSQATTLNFMEAYADYMTTENTNSIYEVKKIDDTTFELKVFANTMMVDDISIVSFYENMGIYGLSGQEIIILVHFNEDYTDFTETFTLTNLWASIDGQTYPVILESFIRMNIESFDDIDLPIDKPNATMNLTHELDAPFFIKGIHNSRYEITPGTQYLHLWLEYGEYQLDISNSYPLDIRILDEQGKIIDVDHRFKISKRGLYVVELTSSERFFTDISIKENSFVHYQVIDLNLEDGVIETSIDLQGTSLYTIKVPSSSEDRVLMILPMFNNGSSIEKIYLMQDYPRLDYHDTCTIDPTLETQHPCYFVIPANTIQYISLNGIYQGDLNLSYSYSRTHEGDITENDLMNEWLLAFPTWINDDDRDINIQFTIYETGYYELQTIYKQWLPSVQYATLIDSYGQILHYDWDHSMYLESGTYTVLYHVVSDTGSVKVLCIPTLIKQE